MKREDDKRGRGLAWPQSIILSIDQTGQQSVTDGDIGNYRACDPYLGDIISLGLGKAISNQI